MLFNSFGFLALYLPVTLLVFYALGSRSRQYAIRWLIIASLVFYGFWRPLNVLIILPSIAINFAIASILLRLNSDDGPRSRSKALLIAGIFFNVAFLGVFKYTDFVTGAINDALATHLPLLHIILPLGISFITFQKIAFLVDVQAGRVRSFSLQEYCTFVLFFPQLIAGPIVHYREMMPQFNAVSCRFDEQNFAIGLTLLVFGLFKKVVIADSIAHYVTPIYEHSAAGGQTSALLAWVAAVGFTLQIYFDFSGYTDMALGLARFFGIKLPQNFNSPLRAASIIDFWLRWHMTLTRFLTAYIYNPLLLTLTRQRQSRGKPVFSGRNTTVGAFLSLLMFPTMTTMFISGVWHGAGYGFIIWGLLHGLYLTINHAWRLTAARLWSDRVQYHRVMRPAGLVLTFVVVTATMVFFRASTIDSALDMVKGLIGLNGSSLHGITQHDTGIFADWVMRDFIKMAFWIIGPMAIALACPNTMQILARYEPALGVRPEPALLVTGTPVMWNISVRWGLAVSAAAAIAVVFMGPSEFLYWQF